MSKQQILLTLQQQHEVRVLGEQLGADKIDFPTYHLLMYRIYQPELFEGYTEF